MNTEGQQDSITEGSELQTWRPEMFLQSVSQTEARYSSGFLRCRPERWFPGISTHWLPIAHALGWDLRCLDIKPVIQSAVDHTFGYVATIDSEPLAVAFDQQVAERLVNICIPGVTNKAGTVLLEYLARRFMCSLASAWSVTDHAVLRYESDLKISTLQLESAVDIVFSINGINLKIALLLGRSLTDRLDGLWRRQLAANSRQSETARKISIELAHLVVAPTMLTQYLKSGTDIDLDTPVSDKVTIYNDNQPWLVGRVVRIDERLGVQVGITSPMKSNIAQGSTQLSVQFGSITLNSDNLIELSQPGAIMQMGFNISDQVKLVVDGQAVGTARLKVYQGRYAITVT